MIDVCSRLELYEEIKRVTIFFLHTFLSLSKGEHFHFRCEIFHFERELSNFSRVKLRVVRFKMEFVVM